MVNDPLSDGLHVRESSGSMESSVPPSTLAATPAMSPLARWSAILAELSLNEKSGGYEHTHSWRLFMAPCSYILVFGAVCILSRADFMSPGM
jgi:hypothetical protein